MNLPAGGRATGLDQVPESLFPLLACRSALPLTALDIVAGVAIFFVGDLLLSHLLSGQQLKFGIFQGPEQLVDLPFYNDAEFSGLHRQATDKLGKKKSWFGSW